MTKGPFRVIEGGRSSPTAPAVDAAADWTAKLNQLRKIENILRHRHHSKLGPKLGFSLAIGLGTGFITYVFICFWNGYTGSSIMLGQLIVTAVLALIATGATFRFTRLPGTYTEMLDDLLSTYQPASVQDYRSLQSDVKAAGGIYSEDVYQWLDRERYYISQMANVKPTSTKFTNRKV